MVREPGGFYLQRIRGENGGDTRVPCAEQMLRILRIVVSKGSCLGVTPGWLRCLWRSRMVGQPAAEALSAPPVVEV